MDFCYGFFERWFGDVGHQDCGSLSSEKDCGFETDAAVDESMIEIRHFDRFHSI